MAPVPAPQPVPVPATTPELELPKPFVNKAWAVSRDLNTGEVHYELVTIH